MTDHFTARSVAELCQLAYSNDGETFGEWAERIPDNVAAIVPGFEDMHVYQHAGAEAFLAVGCPFCVLVHRGSSTVSDWIDNTLAVQTRENALEFEGAKTHYGATSSGRRMWEECVADVASLEQDRLVIHAGHSRGGAIAIDTALRAMQDHLHTYRLVTFGAPRYGNRTAAMLIRGLLQDRIRRFVYTTDPVPHVPLPIRYRHAGRPIYLDSDGNAHYKPTWRYQFIDRIAVAINDWWNAGIQTSSRHMMSEYITALETAEARGSLL